MTTIKVYLILKTQCSKLNAFYNYFFINVINVFKPTNIQQDM